MKKITAPTAAEVSRQFQLKEKPRQLLAAKATPREFLDALVQHQEYDAAIDFLAHALPKRDAVWWGCLCVRHAGGAALPPPQLAALKAAAQWVAEPSEANRRAIEGPANAADLASPGGCVAISAFWSDGSLNPPELPAVPPHPLMTAQAVAAAVTLASTLGDPAASSTTQYQFVELGIGIGEGKHGWPSLPKKAQ